MRGSFYLSTALKISMAYPVLLTVTAMELPSIPVFLFYRFMIDKNQNS
jgi:hypothetical protein